MTKKRIAFQGEPAPIRISPAARPIRDYEPVPCPTFEDAFAAVTSGEADAWHDPDREFGRRARRRHPSPDAAIRTCTSSPSGSCRCSIS